MDLERNIPNEPSNSGSPGGYSSGVQGNGTQWLLGTLNERSALTLEAVLRVEKQMQIHTKKISVLEEQVRTLQTASHKSSTTSLSVASASATNKILVAINTVWAAVLAMLSYLRLGH